jgi:hypothetical protein
VAGGHGCVALALLAYGITNSVVIVDPFRPRTFDHAYKSLQDAGLLPPQSEVRYDERPLSEALPALLGTSGSSRALAVEEGRVSVPVPAVVACHACAHLTLQIVELASVAHAPMICVMPCCHSAKVLGSKFKAAADALGMPLVRKTSFFEFSLCLSRACLGKMIVFIYKWLKKPFSAGCLCGCGAVWRPWCSGI